MFFPQVIYKQGEPWWNDTGRGKLICPPELSGNPTSNHLSSKQDKVGKGNDKFDLRNIFVHTSKWFLTCRKILRHGAHGFTSTPKERVPLKIHRPRLGLNPQTLGPMASSLAITPPRRLYRPMDKSIVLKTSTFMGLLYSGNKMKAQQKDDRPIYPPAQCSTSKTNCQISMTFGI
jgi:hypothetical protein